MELEWKLVSKTDADLVTLSHELDTFYFDRFGDEYLSYLPLNALNGIEGALVAYQADEPCGCCCWKRLDGETAEIKRVFVKPALRRQGAARRMLAVLERHVAQSGYRRAVLETAKDTPEAIAFYREIGYTVMEAGFGPYVGDENCVCLAKNLADGATK